MRTIMRTMPPQWRGCVMLDWCLHAYLLRRSLLALCGRSLAVFLAVIFRTIVESRNLLEKLGTGYGRTRVSRQYCR